MHGNAGAPPVEQTALAMLVNSVIYAELSLLAKETKQVLLHNCYDQNRTV